jgi:response regulator of citrate/malate metabolism
MEDYRVLIVEDDFRVANIWKEFTHSIPGFTVTGTVNGGENALKHLDKEATDLMIMDVYMPDIDGVQLLHEIRKKRASLDVIVITAAKESKVIQRIMRMGILDYIIKPCVLERYQISLGRFKQVRETFENEELEQQELDELLHWPAGSLSNSRRLPKGMQELTMKKILRCFDQNPYARSAEEIAKATGLSLATVQRYLRHLADNSLIKKELTYGSQGRPEHKYTKA